MLLYISRDGEFFGGIVVYLSRSRLLALVLSAYCCDSSRWDALLAVCIFRSVRTEGYPCTSPSSLVDAAATRSTSVTL